MRLLEVLLVVLTASAAVCLLISCWPRAGRIFLAGALVDAIAHGILEGAHWQMIPAYASTGILCFFVWKQGVREQRPQIFKALSVLLLAAVSIVFSILLPMFRLPSPTGTYPVGTSILYFKDSTRSEEAAPGSGSQRELMVQLWYPAQSSHNHFARYREPRETNALSSYQSVLPTNSRLDAPVAAESAPFPVILFNHGWHGMRTSSTFLTEELASHGYVVASIDHTYNANLVAFPDGLIVHGIVSHDIDDPETSTPKHVRAIWDKELSKWVADQRFVIDRLEAMNRAAGTPWFGRLNTNMVGAIGHSYGGAAATAVCAADPRVRAAVNMDGWYFDAIRARGANQALFSIGPYAVQDGATHDLDGTVEAVLDASDSADTVASLRRFGGDQLIIQGAAHEDFTDQPLISPLRILSHRGALPASRIQAIVRRYVLAFFDKTLRGEDPAILHTNSRPYAEAWLEEWPER